MLKRLKSYFSFTKKELNGIVVLFVLIFTTAIFPVLYSLFSEKKQFDFSSFAAEVDSFYTSNRHRSNQSNEQLRAEIEEQELVASYFDFDPNGLSESDWEKLGLSAKQIKVIKNYEARGGRFLKKEDLKKIYSISADKYAMLEPYIKIKDRPADRDLYREGREAAKQPVLILEINKADSAELEMLKGIGPAFASRIVKYRQRLGGFHSISQLREVYGLDSTRFEQLKEQITLDPSIIIQTNINQANFEDLKRYPFLTYKQVNAILQYRKQHGAYTSIDDLRKIKVLNDEILSKIAPYLSY